MREILFRGKSSETGKWREGCLLNVTLDGVTYNIVFGDDFARSGTGVTAMAHSCVYPETVGQFTGLTDKNGKKIFEGDIVEYNNGFDYFKGFVVFENGSFGIGGYEVIGLSSGCCDNFANLWQLFWDQEVTDEPELYCCTVIGNIHDNPELLEGGAGNG